ncbi:MAG TPA: mechanosensitive channel MscK, partial [Pasteurellaceae bacterium]|nr:mechanosensitive channel MscK [Pasteurellaceae bacterium]
MIKKIGQSLLLGLGLLFIFSAAASAATLPTEKDIQSQLDAVKNEKPENAGNKALIKELEDTLSLLNQINQQKEDNKKLDDQIRDAAKLIKTSKTNIEKMKAQEATQKKDNLTKLSIEDLQKQLSSTQANVQEVKDSLSSLNTSLSAQKSVPERAQAALTENLARNQQLNKLLQGAKADSVLKTKYETELALLELKNSYNQTLLSGNDELTTIYSSQVEEKELFSQQLQTQLAELQEVINVKYLQESKKQVEQAAQSQQENVNTNPVVMRELELNTTLSQELLKQTTQMNALSQDNLRIKSMLDNLQQTQRNIDEQISALQGTLVLSRIINKQKQALPQEQMIKDLSKQIADLRVRIFDITEFKDHN